MHFVLYTLFVGYTAKNVFLMLSCYNVKKRGIKNTVDCRLWTWVTKFSEKWLNFCLKIEDSAFFHSLRVFFVLVLPCWLAEKKKPISEIRSEIFLKQLFNKDVFHNHFFISQSRFGDVCKNYCSYIEMMHRRQK